MFKLLCVVTMILAAGYVLKPSAATLRNTAVQAAATTEDTLDSMRDGTASFRRAVAVERLGRRVRRLVGAQ